MNIKLLVWPFGSFQAPFHFKARPSVLIKYCKVRNPLNIIGIILEYDAPRKALPYILNQARLETILFHQTASCQALHEKIKAECAVFGHILPSFHFSECFYFEFSLPANIFSLKFRFSCSALRIAKSIPDEL